MTIRYASAGYRGPMDGYLHDREAMCQYECSRRGIRLSQLDAVKTLRRAPLRKPAAYWQ
jgi:hypothetical protein